ncbi:MAG: helix-turn-helix transcriptional regulator [Actinomycetota bacterium]
MPRNRQSSAAGSEPLPPCIRPVRFEYDRGHTTGAHSHDEHQLVYASRGLLRVDTSAARSVVPPQRAVWVPARIAHEVSAMTVSEMSTLYISRSVTIPRLDDVAVITVSPLLRELIAHLFDTDPTGPIRHRLEAVLIDQLADAPTPELSLPQLLDGRLRAIGEALAADPADGRTLPEFGRAVGAGERTLQRLFQQETGTTFGRWRTQLRLQHAIIVLGRDGNVTAAAAAVGYREPSAFIAAFRRTFGTTPARYLAGEQAAGTGGGAHG